MNWLTALFRPMTAQQLMQRQLQDAERMQAEHLAATEYHAALAGMYGARVARIRKTSTTPELRAVK